MNHRLIVLTIIISSIILINSNSFSQLGNQNMNLLSNLNQHYATQLYSACWGYRAPNGREYAILGCPTGTSFVDITDSTNIHECDFQSGLTSSWREMKVYSHYAYIVSEASNSGLQIIDLAYLPDSVHLVGVFTYTNYTHTHSISQDGAYLYINGGNVTQGLSDPGGVTILDLTNPEVPVKRGSWGNYYVHDCRVRQDTIWACNIYNPPGTISVINANNKDVLTTINSWINNPNPFPHNCALFPGRTYIATTDETSTPNGKLKIWNISNLSNVTLVTSWQPTGITTAIVHNVELYNNGTLAVIAHYTAGVRVVNVTNPASPVEVAWYDTYPSSDGNSFNGVWGVFMFPSGKIIASDRNTGLYVFRPVLGPTGIENQNSIPESFELKQNYPNPFNPTTRIEYNLPNDSYVTIKVFDVTGRQIAILADEYKRAGNYNLSFDAGRLSSGVYYYNIEAGSFTESKKMILVK
jgi:choice-of-anchor B domain-containing protein